MNVKNYDAVIIGAGLTGLTLAYYLKKNGLNILVVEKNSHIGGVIHTNKENDFVYETGPNSGIISTLEAVELFEDLRDDCHLEIADNESKDRWIWKNGKWHSLPSSIKAGIKTELFSLGDKFRLLLEPFKPKGTNPEESIADLVVRRLGKSFLDYAVDPFISGIYAGNPNKLITKFALPKLYNLEQNYGSFIGGAIKKKFENTDPKLKKISREVFSIELGLQNLVDALEEYIGSENILTACKDTSLNLDSKPYSITFSNSGVNYNIKSDIIVSSMGGYALENLLKSINKSEINEIVNLKYTKVVQAIIGYKNWTGIPLKAFGGLVPSVEKRDILGILFISSIFKKRAPKNGALLSVFMGGERRPDIINMSDDELNRIAMQEIDEMLKPTSNKPELVKFYRYEKAIPQYEISTGLRLQQIANVELKYPGLFLAGNIRNGIGMADRIAQSKQLVDTILTSRA